MKPYIACPKCGTYLGDGYNVGDLCLECHEETEAAEPPPEEQK